MTLKVILPDMHGVVPVLSQPLGNKGRQRPPGTSRCHQGQFTLEHGVSRVVQSLLNVLALEVREKAMAPLWQAWPIH